VHGLLGVLPAMRLFIVQVHGSYRRIVAEGVAGGRPVLILLRVRRFRCCGPSCPRAAFVAQEDGLTSRYCRRSVPLTAMLTGFRLELAGRAGPAGRPPGHRGSLLDAAAALEGLPEPGVAAAQEAAGIDDSRCARGMSTARC
jgi:hypothetical protein